MTKFNSNVISLARTDPEIGGRMSFAEKPRLRETMLYLDKSLKGSKAANLPVWQPNNFEMVINLKTAKAWCRIW